jgi:hypothetical protein
MCINYEKQQVIFAVRKLFKLTEHEEVLSALNLDDKESFRVYLAILKLSKGNLEQFYSYLKKANLDYRDVLWWAEYDPNDNGKKIENPYKAILK